MRFPGSPPIFSDRRLHEVRKKSAGKNRRGKTQRQIDAERKDQRRFAEHLHNQRNQRAHAEQKIGHRLPAHESHHQRLHDRCLRRGKNRTHVAGRGLAELEGMRQQHNRQPGCRSRCNHCHKLHFLLCRRRTAEPIAGFQVGDELA